MFLLQRFTIVFLSIILNNLRVVYGATHWVVTEKGLVQSHVGSPLDIRRPYDLISLLDQEKRWNEIQSVLNDLFARKTQIEDKWCAVQGNAAIDPAKLVHQNVNCSMDQKMLGIIRTYGRIATNGSERVKIARKETNQYFHSVQKSEKSGTSNRNRYSAPDCEKYLELKLKKETVETVQYTKDFNTSLYTHEEFLEDLLPRGKTVEHFGNDIHLGLLRNSSSWYHYNLAALFWRMNGDGEKALECCRRALHFVPKLYSDIVFHNFAGILHRAKSSLEAIIMLQKAVFIAPNQPLHYTALGYIYSTLGDYNNSIANYDKYLNLKPNQDEVKAMKDMTVCFSKAETHLLDLQENVLGSLQDILTNLYDFHGLQRDWLRLSKRLMWEHSSYDDSGNDLNTDLTLNAMFQKHNQELNLIQDFDTLSLQHLLKYVEAETKRISGKETPKVPSSNEEYTMVDPILEDLRQNEKIFPKFHNAMPTKENLYFDSPGWPSEEDCSKWELTKNIDNSVLPVFMPPENKGYNVSYILSLGIGLEEGVEHKLPWYPPICDETVTFREKYVIQLDKKILNNELKPNNNYLRKYLLKYVNNGMANEAEIGQRIITAIEKSNAPKFVLTTLASLYWRVRGNTKRTLDCLDMALQLTPKTFTDVILTSIGSVFYELGDYQQALKYGNLAFKLNYVEPSTNFLLALLHQHTNPLLSLYYMKNVLRADADYYEGQAVKMLKIWACKIKQGHYKAQIGKNTIRKEDQPNVNGEDEVCLEGDSFSSHGVLCSKSGGDCKPAQIECFRTKPVEGDVDHRQFSLINFKSGPKNIIFTPISSADDEEFSKNFFTTEQFERHENVFATTSSNQPFHMRIFLGDDNTGRVRLGDFYVTLKDEARSVIQVYDQSGTYKLSGDICKDIIDIEWVQFSTMWQWTIKRNFNIATSLHAHIKKSTKKTIKPLCGAAPIHSPISVVLNELARTLLREKHSESVDNTVAEWLSIVVDDSTISLQEIGNRIGVALHANQTSWILANAAALYWRAIGNFEQSILCSRLALAHVPIDLRDIPLITLANILYRIGWNADALEVTYLAFQAQPDFVVNHYMLGMIFTSDGDLEKAISFYRSALAFEPNYQPARNRLKAILCALLFDEDGELRNSKEYDHYNSDDGN